MSFASYPSSSFNNNNNFMSPQTSSTTGGKIGFVLIVLLVFAIALRLTISTLSYFLMRPRTLKVINGMVDGRSQIIIPQDPSSQGAKTIYRSVNESDGIEFSWSVWVFVDNMSYNSGQYRTVFYKGNEKTSAIVKSAHEQPQGMNFPNNAPGLYIAPNTNKFVVLMNTFNVINEEIIVDDVPLNKWVNVVIRCRNNIIDVYINGSVIKSHYLAGVPKQNYGDVYVGTMGGFSGNLSNLWYFNYALDAAQIDNIMTQGPDITQSTASSTGINQLDSDYLSLRWFLKGIASNN